MFRSRLSMSFVHRDSFKGRRVIMVCMTSELSDRLKRRSIFFQESTEVKNLFLHSALCCFYRPAAIPALCPLR